MITKELKYATFEYDSEKREFRIIPPIGEDGHPNWGNNRYIMEGAIPGSLILNKTYAFAFMRFILRFAQKALFRKFTRKEVIK